MRSSIMRNFGIRTIRFSNEEVIHNSSEVLKKINDISSSPLPLSHFPVREGKGLGDGVSVPSGKTALNAMIAFSFLILSCAPGTQSLRTSMPKLKIDPKSIKEIPGHLDLAKLKVIYEDGEFIKWIDEKGRTNISFEPQKYIPKQVKLDEDKFCQVLGTNGNVYEWPDFTSKIIDQVNSNEIIKVVEEYKYFTKVNTTRNIEGWIERSVMNDYLLKKTANANFSVVRESDYLVIRNKDGAVIKKEFMRETVTKSVASISDVKLIYTTYDPLMYQSVQDKLPGVFQTNKISSVKVDISRTQALSKLTYSYNIAIQFLDVNKREVFQDLFSGIMNASGERMISINGVIEGASSYYYNGYVYNMLSVELSWTPPEGRIPTDGRPLDWCMIYRNGMLIFSGQDSAEYSYSYIPNIQMALITHKTDITEDFIFDPIKKIKIYAVTNISLSQSQLYYAIKYDKSGNIYRHDVKVRIDKDGAALNESIKTNFLFNVYSNGYRK